MAQSSTSPSSLSNDSIGFTSQRHQLEPHPVFAFTSNLDPSLAMNSTLSNSGFMDDQPAGLGSIFPSIFTSYQTPGLVATNNYTVSNRPDEIQSTNSAHCINDLSFTGSWMDMRTSAPSPPSTLFPTSNEQARGPQKEIVEDETHCSSCHKSKPQKPHGHFECGWKNCKNPGPFTKKAVLMRHIETLHISPRSFVCTAGSCKKSFNRKDNLDTHFRSVHRESRG